MRQFQTRNVVVEIVTESTDPAIVLRITAPKSAWETARDILGDNISKNPKVSALWDMLDDAVNSL